MKYIFDDGTVKIRNSVFWDVTSMKNRLRSSDLEEIDASHGWTGEQALLYGLHYSSLCGTVLYKMHPTCMFGVVPDRQTERIGTAWLLATDDLACMWRTFVRLTPVMLQSMLNVRPVLCNFIDARHEKSIRWLRWSGAKINDPAPYGLKNMPFHFFTLERKAVHV